MIHAVREWEVDTIMGSNDGATSLHIKSILVMIALICVRPYDVSDMAEDLEISNQTAEGSYAREIYLAQQG
jgi:hypothetical protein